MPILSLEKLEACMADTSDVYVGAGWDRESYLKGVEQGLRDAVCSPFPVSAIVEEPGSQTPTLVPQYRACAWRALKDIGWYISPRMTDSCVFGEESREAVGAWNMGLPFGVLDGLMVKSDNRLRRERSCVHEGIPRA
jgi:hypothetical protein